MQLERMSTPTSWPPSSWAPTSSPPAPSSWAPSPELPREALKETTRPWGEPVDTFQASQPSHEPSLNAMRTLARTQQTSPPSEHALKVARQIGSLIGPGNKHAALKEPYLSKVARSLDKLPPKVIDMMVSKGMKIEVFDPPPADWVKGNCAVYDPRAKSLQLLGNKLDGSEGADVTIHELGHALDDLLQKNVSKNAFGDPCPDYKTDKLPGFAKLFEKYMERVSHDPAKYTIGVPMRNPNPREWFAEGFRLYNESPQTRAELKAKAPELYAIIEKSIAQASEGH